MHALLDTDGGVALISGVLALIGIIVGEVLRRQGNALKEVREHAAAVREQTQNSHTTNLRDDIDAVKDGVSALLMGQQLHADAITNLRTDLAWERRERMDLASRVSRIDNLPGGDY